MPAPQPLPLAPHEGRELSANEVTPGPDGVLRLRGARCADCGMTVFPAPASCPGCLSARVETFALGAEGRLYSYTQVHIAPPGWQTPYVVGYVDLPDGVRIFGKVKASDTGVLQVDMPVTVQVIPSADDNTAGDRYRYYFAPPLTARMEGA